MTLSPENIKNNNNKKKKKKKKQMCYIMLSIGVSVENIKINKNKLLETACDIFIKRGTGFHRNM